MPDSSWTETGSSISLIPTTTPIDPGSSPSNVNYLTNSYKAALMQQYAGELAMKTSLDSLATTWGCSATAYNNAVAAINTTITGFSGAPANWATIWPDGTMSGPWMGVQTMLSSNWSAIATQRTALQGAISAAQAAAAQSAAVTAAILAAQPHAVAWAYASKPALPSASYPAGYYAITTDSRTVQVDAAGAAWVDVLVATTGLFGQITVGQITTGAAIADIARVGSLTAGYIYFTDGFCLNTLEPKESGANVTSGHILTANSKPLNTVTVTGIPEVLIGGFAFSVNAASTADVYNIFGRIAGRQTAGSTGADCYIDLYVDGVNKTYQDCYFAGGLNTDGMCAFYMSITGLTAGAHTFQFYAHSGASGTSWTIWNTSTALCQRIF